MEHRIILGGEQFLPFARSRIKALKALGLTYASQSFEVDGVSIKVRIEPGHEYIRIEGGQEGGACVFSSVQCPDVSATKLHIPGVKAKGYNGAYSIVPKEPTQSLQALTAFGVSPYKFAHIRVSQVIATPEPSQIPAGVIFRSGVYGSSTQRANAFIEGTLVKSFALSTYYNGYREWLTYLHPIDQNIVVQGHESKFVTGSMEHVPSTNAGVTPLCAMLFVNTMDNKRVNNAVSPIVIDDSYSSIGENTQNAIGVSFIKILRAKSSGTPPVYQVEEFNCGGLNYSYRNGTDVEFSVATGEDKSDATYTIVNDVERTVPWHRWHSSNRVATDVRGTTFVLRSKSCIEAHYTTYVQPPNTPSVSTLAVSNGYSLSFLSPDGVVADNKITQDLGPYGFIAEIIPSSTGKKAYVYYMLHDDTNETMNPTGTDIEFTLPTKYIEHLDTIDVTRNEDGDYVYEKSGTAVLGSITLAKYENAGNTIFQSYTSCTAYRLRNAAQETGGYIWAEKYCYVIADNFFISLPALPVADTSAVPMPGNRRNEQLTGNESRTSTYMHVRADGKKAIYLMTKIGLMVTCSIRKETNGSYTVTTTSKPMSADSNGADDATGLSVVFGL